MKLSTLFRLEEDLNLDKNTLVILRWIAIIGQLTAINLVYFYLKLEFPILITDKNKNNQLLGRSPYNQTVYIDEENFPFKKHHEKLIGSMLDVKIIKSNQNSLLGSFTKNA